MEGHFFDCLLAVKVKRGLMPTHRVRVCHLLEVLPEFRVLGEVLHLAVLLFSLQRRLFFIRRVEDFRMLLLGFRISVLRRSLFYVHFLLR